MRDSAKLNSTSLCLRGVVLLLVTLCVMTTGARAERQKIARALKPELQNKNLVLRGFYKGEELRYHSDGSLANKAAQGYWSSDGLIHIAAVSEKKHLLQLKGTRVISIFDAKTKCFQNAITDAQVQIDIELNPKWRDATPVRALLNQIFGFGIGTLQAYVPDYWQSWFTGEATQMPNGEWKFVSAASKTTVATDDAKIAEGTKLYKVGERTSAPRVIFAPDPEYTFVAKTFHLSGTSILWVIVAPDGKAADIQVQQPLGGGLDDQAVAIVRRWKFKPAMRGGQPVAVQINIEVDFKLY